MKEQELDAILSSEIHHAMGYIGGDLSDQRRKAMKYYLSQPFGNEIEGRSQVVLSDVADTVEWILPSLMRMFTSKSDAIVFEPVGPEDEEAAAQESDYINHMFYKENNGFLLLYTWFKDALLSKNGIMKAWWDDTPVKERETYRGLDDAELAELVQDQYIEVIEYSETPFGHDVTVLCTKSKGQLRLEVVPPEEFLVSREARSLDLSNARFVAHRVRKTISELREAGYSKKQLEHLPQGEDDGGSIFNEETFDRRHLDDERTEQHQSVIDDSQREVWVYECYTRVDFDGDGIAELRKITRIGNESLDNEVVDSRPFYAITPVILTHKFYGLSIADLVMDLQLIRSTLLRQMLDNLYLTNNPEREVVDKQVNMEDMMTSRPGGIKRVKQPGVIRDLTVPFTAGSSFPMMEYIDSIRKDRTGVGDDVMGLDSNTLSNANTGVVAQSFDAAHMRIELIARIFAETGIKSLMLGIHELLQKHQDKEKVVKLRNKWVPVSPTEWRSRSNMTINVGLGTGNRDQQLVHLENIIQKQAAVAQNGGMGTLVTPSNIYHALSRLVENAGLKAPELYFTDPTTVEPPAQEEEQPDAQILAIQVQAQIEQQKLALEEKKLELEHAKLQGGADMQREELNLKRELETLKQEVAIYIANAKAAPAVEAQPIAAELSEIDEAVEAVAGIDGSDDERDSRIEGLAASLAQIAEFVERGQQSTAQSVGQVAAQVADLAQQLVQVNAELAAPKDVERDQEGRIIRVGKRKVARGNDGAIQSIQ